jgi:hypothetical protein
MQLAIKTNRHFYIAFKRRAIKMFDQLLCTALLEEFDMYRADALASFCL